MGEFAEERMSICNICEYNEGGECLGCGCLLSYKTAQPEESCPLNEPRWIALSKIVIPKPEIQSAPAQVPTLASTAPQPTKPCIPCNQRNR